MCAAMIAAMPMSSVNAAESGKHFTAGATTGFFGAESLDVAYNWDGWIMSIYGISENLFRLDASYVPQPWIAESYENVDDLTWKFTIRDGVTFSDGNPVTAEAVKKCFERTYANNDRAGSTLAIASMEADGQVLTIVTETPNPTILNGASGDTELFEKASNINGFQGGRVANNLYISPFRATVFKTAALFLYLNSSVVIRVRKPLFFPL